MSLQPAQRAEGGVGKGAESEGVPSLSKGVSIVPLEWRLEGAQSVVIIALVVMGRGGGGIVAAEDQSRGFGNQ